MPNSPGIIPQPGVYGYGSGESDPESQDNSVIAQFGTYNVNPLAGSGKESTLPKWRQSYDSPNGPLKCCYIGDSLTAALAQGGTTIPYPGRVGRIHRNMCGLQDGGIGFVGPTMMDVAGSGVVSAGAPALCGQGSGVGSSARFLTAAASLTFNTNNMNWALNTTKVCQTMDLLYIDIGGFGADISFKIDGGATQTLVTAKIGDSLVKSVQIPAGAAPAGLTNAVHSVQVFSAGIVSFVGAIIYSGTAGANGLMTYNAGVFGSTSFDWASPTVGHPTAMDFISVIAPNITFICLGVNDQLSPNVKNIFAYKTNMAAIITAAQAQGDVALIAPWASNTFVFSPAIQNFTFYQVDQALQELCVQFNIPMLNMHVCWGDFGAYSASGMSGDGFVHANNKGQQDLANRVWKLMNNA